MIDRRSARPTFVFKLDPSLTGGSLTRDNLAQRGIILPIGAVTIWHNPDPNPKLFSFGKLSLPNLFPQFAIPISHHFIWQLASWTQFKLCKNQRFDLPGPKTRFFSTRRPQNLHVVHSAQTRTRPLAIDMHVGERANTRSRDPGRTKLYCQSMCSTQATSVHIAPE